MTDHPTDETLTFKNTPIRIAMIGKVPWFCASDIAEAMGWGPIQLAKLDDPKFPAFAKTTCSEEADDRLQETVMLSGVGVWYLTDLINPAKGQALANWARRESVNLCPEPAENDPAMFLTLLPRGGLPPRPWPYSGRRAEWEALRWSDEYINGARGQVTLKERMATARLKVAAAA